MSITKQESKERTLSLQESINKIERRLKDKDYYLSKGAIECAERDLFSMKVEFNKLSGIEIFKGRSL